MNRLYWFMYYGTSILDYLLTVKVAFEFRLLQSFENTNSGKIVSQSSRLMWRW